MVAPLSIPVVLLWVSSLAADSLSKGLLLIATSNGIDRAVITVGSDHLFDILALRYAMYQIYGRSL